jgi:hypothetical protein
MLMFGNILNCSTYMFRNAAIMSLFFNYIKHYKKFEKKCTDITCVFHSSLQLEFKKHFC